MFIKLVRPHQKKADAQTAIKTVQNWVAKGILDNETAQTTINGLNTYVNQ